MIFLACDWIISQATGRQLISLLIFFTLSVHFKSNNKVMIKSIIRLIGLLTFFVFVCNNTQYFGQIPGTRCSLSTTFDDVYAYQWSNSSSTSANLWECLHCYESLSSGMGSLHEKHIQSIKTNMRSLVHVMCDDKSYDALMMFYIDPNKNNSKQKYIQFIKTLKKISNEAKEGGYRTKTILDKINVDRMWLIYPIMKKSGILDENVLKRVCENNNGNNDDDKATQNVIDTMVDYYIYDMCWYETCYKFVFLMIWQITMFGLFIGVLLICYQYDTSKSSINTNCDLLNTLFRMNAIFGLLLFLLGQSVFSWKTGFHY